MRGQSTSDGGRLGNLSTFFTYYKKGSPQLHSGFKAALCQRIYSTFKLSRAEDGWLDPCCGGGVRQHVAALCGLKACGIDLRAEAIADCRRKAAVIGGIKDGMCSFIEADMRHCAAAVGKADCGTFGGLFTSIPFYRVECYDLGDDDKPIKLRGWPDGTLQKL